MSKPTVFLSYSHEDEKWKDELSVQLNVLEDLLGVWDDRQIDGGDTWFDKIRSAMDGAAVAVCLISADYLTSDFCKKEEIPYLLKRRAEHGMRLLPILLRPCPWKLVSWLKAIQILPRDNRPIASLSSAEREEVFAEIAESIGDWLKEQGKMAIPRGEFAPEPPAGFQIKSVLPTEDTFSAHEEISSDVATNDDSSVLAKVNITRLPVTGVELFGRDIELNWLDELWLQGNVRVVSLVAFGGVGKSTLINKWLERLKADSWRSAKRVFGWSFYSQGIGQRVTSADVFVDEALRWFGDSASASGSPWARGERLAELIKKERTLLVLDGLEPLQSSNEGERGFIKDPALSTLLTELAHPAGDKGGWLCVITSRLNVVDLDNFAETVQQRNLEQISAGAGRALLRVLGGVRGIDAELEAASHRFGNHALAVKLLAAFLKDSPGHSIEGALSIPDPGNWNDNDRHAFRVMDAFAQRFGTGPKVDLLSVLGVFDRPLSLSTLEEVCANPIPGATEHLAKLSRADFLILLGELRTSELIAKIDYHAPDEIDAHPLVREYFGARLRAHSPMGWRAINSRLYIHYARTADAYPRDVQGMTLLQAAIVHGCRSERYLEAFEEIYSSRMLRGQTSFLTEKLGAYGMDQLVLESFFEIPWSTPAAQLRLRKAAVLEQAGLSLRATGRLLESIQSLQAAFDLAQQGKEVGNASRCASLLSEVRLSLGQLDLALDSAQHGVNFADQSGDHTRQILSRVVLGDALHQRGEFQDAMEAFREAVQIQGDFRPLKSLEGFRYCDLLLSISDEAEAESVARGMIALADRPIKSDAKNRPLDQATLGRLLYEGALGRLCLARVILAVPPHDSDSLDQAAKAIEDGIEALHRSGMQLLLPKFFLTRAYWCRLKGEYRRCHVDLGRVLLFSSLHGMRLNEADCHLGFAHLHLCEGYLDRARESLDRARVLITDMGYHRQDREVAELERRL